MPRIILVLAVICLLVACQAPPRVSVPEPVQLAVPEVDQPVELEEERFVLRELPVLLQPYGYGGFCPGILRCDDPLPYRAYMGMGGQFEQSEPVKTLPEWNVYRVRLDNGERYFFFANQELGGKYSPVSPIIPEDLHAKVRDFKPQPLVACSDVSIDQATLDFGGVRYSLSGGRTLDDPKLQLIRRFTAEYGARDPEIAEGLLALSITPDSRFDNGSGSGDRSGAYRIAPEGELVANDLRLILRLSEQGPQIYFKTMYVGEKRLNVRSIEFRADEQHWKMTPPGLQRSHKRGQVREWLETPASPEQLVVARRMARAKQAQIRFVGAGYYDILELSQLQKEDLRRVLALFDRLKTVDRSQPVDSLPMNNRLPEAPGDSKLASCANDGDGTPTALK